MAVEFDPLLGKLRTKDSGGGGMSIGGAVTSGTTGSVLYIDGSGNLGQDNASLFWDETNKKLAVSSQIQLGDTNTVLRYNLAEFGTGYFVLDGVSGSAIERGFVSSGQMALYANAGTAGLGNWTPSIALNSSGQIYLKAYDASNVPQLVSIEGNSYQIKASSSSTQTAVIKTDNLTVTRTFQFPDATGTLALTSSIVPLAIGDAVTSGTSGSVLYINSSGQLAQDNANLFWDATNHRLGIGTVAPGEKLDVNGNINIPVTTSLVGIIKQGGSTLLHTYGTSNTFMGVGAGNFTTTGGYSVGIGTSALVALTSGLFNTAVGRIALTAVTTGGRNTAVGSNALSGVTTGSSNVAIGAAALSAISDNSNLVAVGDGAMQNAVSGATEDTALGPTALTILSTGSYNTAMGSNALAAVTTSSYNTGVGRYSGAATTGTGGTFIGMNAATGATTGNYNTIIGSVTAGGLTTGANNTIVGANITGLAATLSNNIILADGAGNQRINVDSTGNVGIGTTTPQTTLDINGGMRTLTNSQSAAYQLLVTDSTVYVTTGTTVGMAVTLPAASANTIGMYFFVYKVDSGIGSVAITPTGTDTINGLNAAKSIANQWNGALVRGLTATSWLATSFTGL